MPRHQNSFITVEARDTYVMELGVSVKTCRRKRSTEVTALDRIAYGDVIAASNAAAVLSSAKNDLLRCSNGHDAHYLAFAECKAYPWRHGGRQYMCRDCMKKARIQGVVIDAADEKYLRSKKNSRRNKGKGKFIEPQARAG